MCLVISVAESNEVNSFSSGRSQKEVTFRVVGASTTKSRGIRNGGILK